MTSDPGAILSAAAPRILLTGDGAVTHPDASVSIRIYDPEAGGASQTTGVIWHLPTGVKPPPSTALCVTDGLTAAAVLAATPQAPKIVPRTEVRQLTQRFGFVPGNAVSGFSTYQLDPASVSAYEVIEDGERVSLGGWLAQAIALGIGEVWLHSPAAEVAQHGFPCAMLAKAHRLAPSLRFWISGGGWRPAHFSAVAGKAGLAALVVPADVAAGYAPGELGAAMAARANGDTRKQGAA